MIEVERRRDSETVEAGGFWLRTGRNVRVSVVRLPFIELAARSRRRAGKARGKGQTMANVSRLKFVKKARQLENWQK
jgi:hypothetical protein